VHKVCSCIIVHTPQASEHLTCASKKRKLGQALYALTVGSSKCYSRRHYGREGPHVLRCGCPSRGAFRSESLEHEITFRIRNEISLNILRLILTFALKEIRLADRDQALLLT
jgi:hypothetical protein